MNVMHVMRRLRRRAALWLALGTALLVGESRLAGAEFNLFKTKPSESKEVPPATAARLKEIDQATKVFADRYANYLADACVRVEKDNPNPEARKQALRIKLFHSASVFGIAAGPNSLGQLLDLCVVVTLGKMNWVEEERAEKIFGADRCQPVIEAFNNAHAEVWELAGRGFAPGRGEGTKKKDRPTAGSPQGHHRAAP